jgi:hypothetical protein
MALYGEDLFQSLVGRTFNKIEVGTEQIRFYTDGPTYLMYHNQDCCESVAVEEIIGDISDLLDSPILKAEVSTSDTNPSVNTTSEEEYRYDDSQTWTFYRLATIKGTVVIRWYGTSNGYYSESVDFTEVKQ